MQAAARGRRCPSKQSTSEGTALPTTGAQPTCTFLSPVSPSPRCHVMLNPSSLTLCPGYKSLPWPCLPWAQLGSLLTTLAQSSRPHVSPVDPSSSSITHNLA